MILKPGVMETLGHALLPVKPSDVYVEDLAFDLEQSSAMAKAKQGWSDILQYRIITLLCLSIQLDCFGGSFML